MFELCTTEEWGNVKALLDQDLWASYRILIEAEDENYQLAAFRNRVTCVDEHINQKK